MAIYRPYHSNHYRNINYDGVYNPTCTDWDGNPVKPTEEHFIWKDPKFDPNTNIAMLANNMWRKTPRLYYNIVRTIWPDKPHRQMFHDIKPTEAELMLRLYLGLNITLTGILTGNDRHGYPYWKFAYIPSKEENRAETYLRTIVQNNYRHNSTVEIPINWKFDTYTAAEQDILALARDTLDAISEKLGNHFTLSDNDDIVTIVDNHIAAIFYEGHDRPIATYDIFGLAAYIDKYNNKHWYYRGFDLYNNGKNNRIYINRNGEPASWRGNLSRALLYIDTLLLKEAMSKNPTKSSSDNQEYTDEELAYLKELGIEVKK